MRILLRRLTLEVGVDRLADRVERRPQVLEVAVSGLLLIV